MRRRKRGASEGEKAVGLKKRKLRQPADSGTLAGAETVSASFRKRSSEVDRERKGEPRREEGPIESAAEIGPEARENSGDAGQGSGTTLQGVERQIIEGV